MTKKQSFFMLVILLFVFVLATISTAGDQTNSGYSLLEQDAVPIISGSINNQADSHFGSFVLASNTASTNAKEKEDDLMEEFDDHTKTSQTVSDPLYYFNYAMYSFNDVFYLGLLEPIADGYKAIFPTIVRKGVKNFFHNLLFPVRFVNNLLQGQFKDAGIETSIFIVNTTVGVLGLSQPAQDGLDLHTADEDLGQTLGAYGIGNGFYIIWPLLGPSTLRDTVGLVGDSFLKPVNYVEPWELALGIKAYDTVNSTSFRIGDYKALKDAAMDPYVAIRNAYIQNRTEKVNQ
ncbi:MAG: VacJ family lipoprotein [Pseudomonadota bacterium]